MQNEHQDFLPETHQTDNQQQVVFIVTVVLILLLILLWWLVQQKTATVKTSQRIIEQEPPKEEIAIPNIFELLPKETKIHLLPVANCPIRPNDTPTLKTVSSCCAAVVKQKLGMINEDREATANISSSLIVMRHFERLDHVEPNWYSRFNQTNYFPHDAPLSPRGILDGMNFTTDLSQRLTKKSRSEDHFSFTVSSPSLRCLQTSILVALETKTAILIEESISDWMNRKVFGANLKEKPETSLKKEKKTVWWVTAEVIRNFLIQLNKQQESSTKITTIEDLAKVGAIVDGENDRVGFFDFSSISQNSENCSNTTVFKNFPETEKDFSERVHEAISKLSQTWKLQSSSKMATTENGGVQKVFSANQVQKDFFSAGQENVQSRLYGLRLFVVSHADFARVAASDLCPRCSCSPTTKDGISVVYGSLSQIVKLVPWKKNNKNSVEQCSYCYHLVCFGSRNPSSLDCPTIG